MASLSFELVVEVLVYGNSFTIVTIILCITYIISIKFIIKFRKLLYQYTHINVIPNKPSKCGIDITKDKNTKRYSSEKKHYILDMEEEYALKSKQILH
eukprot:495645_1